MHWDYLIHFAMDTQGQRRKSPFLSNVLVMPVCTMVKLEPAFLRKPRGEYVSRQSSQTKTTNFSKCRQHDRLNICYL